MKTKFFKPLIWLVVFTLTPFVNYAQEAHATTSNSYFSNALFNALVVVIILLLVLVAVIAGVIKNVAVSDYYKNKLKEKKNTSSTARKTAGMIALFMVMNVAMGAQEKVAVAKDEWLIGGLDMFTFYAMVAIILFEISFLAVLLNILKGLLKAEPKEEVAGAETSTVQKPVEKTILDKFNASVEIEKEEEIMLGHNYDGIRELDNNLPPWWKYGFALTVVIAIIYLTHYHIAKTGDLQGAEYNKEMAKAKFDVDEYLKTSANNVDETTVKLLDKAEDIEAGKQTFIANCVACHGKLANGKLGENDGAGPNLTDNYWLHGGGIAEIFKSIKYGWTDKGMKSWKEDLSPVQIAQIASYIKSLKGSAPTGKAPQGDLYQEAGSPAVKDSLSAPSDSVKIKAIADSLDIAAKAKK
jgi:cytochrome c oxidase cbb3-type subunit 3